MAFRLAPALPATVAAETMVATSQPLATRAGLRPGARGNAADAALAAAAAVLCVTEPMSTGVGGDAFALVWDGERAHGLDAAGPFGVMGGFIQAQAHVQLVSALVDEGLDPQTAFDCPRFRVDGGDVLLEKGLWERAANVEALGLRAVPSRDHRRFGGGQAILRRDGVLLGGSDRRKDGHAAGH